MRMRLFMSAVGLAVAASMPNVAFAQETLAQKVQRIDDILAIERLQNVYGYYVDKRLFEQVVSLFAEKSSVEISHRGVYVGKTGVRRMFIEGWARGKDGLVRGQIFTHMMLQPVIDIDPKGRTAKGRFRTFAQVGSAENGVMWVEGTYENQFVKEDGVWKYSKMKFWPGYYVPEREGFSGRVRPNIEFSTNVPPDLPPSDDAGVFPDIYYPPYHYPNPVTGKPVDVDELNRAALSETTTAKPWKGGEPLNNKPPYKK